MVNLLQQFREQCTRALEVALEKTFPDWAQKIPRPTVPSHLDFGELSSSIAHEIAQQTRHTPQEIAERIKEAIDLTQRALVAGVEAVSGYINFRLDYNIASKLVLEEVVRQDLNYGIERTRMPIRVSVEHTSANPSGPLTMAHARNAILGDALARLLRARGHSVNRRFFVNDVGRQVSILAYGYSLLKARRPQGKIDHWLGRLYACINCAVEIEATKRKLNQLSSDSVDRGALQRTLDEWIGIAAELEATDKELFTQIIDLTKIQADAEDAVQELGRKYEQNDRETANLVREVAELCLNDMNETLAGLGIDFDTWDWESQLVWEGHVEKVLTRLRTLPFTRTEGLSATLDVNAIVEAYSLRDQFRLSPNYEVPSLTLVRSDGTTLYPTRDIVYTLVKFADSDRVINVIASEQSLPQLQIRLALYALGERDAAKNMTHYAYGLVELPGTKMSKRRARYIALDEVIGQAKRRVDETMAQRKEELGATQADEIVRRISLGAIKFAMLNVTSTKNLTFTWDRVLSLERNSAPFINYAYTRAGSILRKVGETPLHADFSLLRHPIEHLLVFKIAQLPDVFQEAADQLKPEELASYANSLAEKFHEYYEKVDVIHSEQRVRDSRALLVRATQVCLRNSMALLGIDLSERM